MGASRAIRVFSKKLLRLRGAVFCGDLGRGGVGVDSMPGTRWGQAERGCGGWGGGVGLGGVLGVSGAGEGGVAPGWRARPAFRGLAGTGRVWAPADAGRGAAAGWFDGCLPKLLGRDGRDGVVGLGVNGREGSTRRRRRRTSCGRCRAERARGIWDRVARFTQLVYIGWGREARIWGGSELREVRIERG